MLDRFNRDIYYLRVSVTDRCNLRCVYCMPEEGIELIPREKILSIEEIAGVVRVGAEKFDISKIRLTGGEPLVRKGIVTLVGLINEIEGIEEITMTTNGILLSEYAERLKKAGLNRVNISLDTLSPQRYRDITRGGDINNVKEGIRTAIEAGLTPIKINVVVTESSDEQDLAALRQYCTDEGLQIRYIEQMNLQTGEFSPVAGGEGGNCKRCNRLRLMSNGNIKPCLFSDSEFNIREYGIEEACRLAMENKPLEGKISGNNRIYNIGG